MARSRSYKAQKLIERMQQKLTRQMVVSLSACVHCGICAEQCHYVTSHPDDPTYSPAYKADRLRRLFKAHLDWTGRVVPWWVGARSVYTDAELEKLKDVVFGKCTNCRRCSLNCPMAVDLATFNRMARGLLSHVGMMPEGLAHVSKDQWETGNQMAVSPEDYLETLQWLEEDLQSTYNDPSFNIPVDKSGADVMYTINPREVKFDPRSLAQAATIFHLAGENWTLPSEGWDMTNFGFFTGDDDLAAAMPSRVYDAAERLGVKKIVMTECGHGYRSLKWEGPNWAKRTVRIPMESIMVTMRDYIQSGRIRVDKTRNSLPITYHDSCNLARSCGLLEEPRELLRLVCTDFREMYPNRAENYCCTGGGGALMMPEYSSRRLESAKAKAEQLQATGAKIVATSCHNCVDGLLDVIAHYKLDMEVMQLVSLVANALILPEQKSPPADAQG